MMRWVPRIGAVLMTAGLVFAACGNGSSPSRASKPKSSRTKTKANAVDPNAPEVNPAGDIPDNQVFVTYSNAAGYAVKVPEGWARSTQSGTISFTDKLNTIRVGTEKLPAPPTVASVRGDELSAIAKGAKHFRAGRVENVTRRIGRGVMATYEMESAPDAVTGKARRLDVERYEFWRKGKALVLVLSAPHGADNVDPWRIVSSSLQWR